jgi:hypothetical protein
MAERIAESPPDDARPGQFLRREGVRGTHVRLWIEAHAQELQEAANRPDQDDVHVFLAHPPVAGEALHALVFVHRGAVQGGIDRDRPHRTDRDAIGARDTLPMIYLQ